jgi:hypothetical protein
MSDSVVIKEFLVGLGFKTDQDGLKKFTTGIDDATKVVANLVAGISFAALAVGGSVMAFASNLEALYFASKRVGASANNIKAFERAGNDLGATTGELKASLEGVASFIRNTPGSGEFFKTLGVDITDANGNARDTVDIMADLAKAFQGMSQPMANQYRQILGIDEHTELAMRSPEFLASLKSYQESLKSTDYDKLASDAHRFENSLRQLETRMMAFAATTMDALSVKIQPQLDKFSAWWDVHGEMIVNRMGEIMSIIIRIGTEAAPYVQSFMDAFVELDKSSDGWSSKIALLGVAFFLFGGKVTGAVTALRTLIGLIPGAGAAAAAVKGGVSAGARKILGGLFGKLGLGIGLLMHSEGLNEGEDEQMKAAWDKYDKQHPQTGVAGAVAYFKKMGWSHEQASGIVANLNAESGMRSNVSGDGGNAYGLGQWHPDRQANFKAWAGKDIRNSTAEEQMAFVNYELTQGAEAKAGALLRATKNSTDAGSLVSRAYERPADADGEAFRRGQAAAQIAQTTTINVNGVSDPQAAGNAVAKEQDAINMRLTRNLKGATS